MNSHDPRRSPPILSGLLVALAIAACEGKVGGISGQPGGGGPGSQGTGGGGAPVGSGGTPGMPGSAGAGGRTGAGAGLDLIGPAVAESAGALVNQGATT